MMSTILQAITISKLQGVSTANVLRLAPGALARTFNPESLEGAPRSISSPLSNLIFYFHLATST